MPGFLRRKRSKQFVGRELNLPLVTLCGVSALTRAVGFKVPSALHPEVLSCRRLFAAQCGAKLEESNFALCELGAPLNMQKKLAAMVVILG
mmetsp:Transcript_46777/g.93701  ORF Transcript_46777/g.93701 Transcript_46777/m.93701 type:complete len:91 (-) Transcript_46777:253-525(-)